MQKEVEVLVTFHKDGTVTKEAIGFEGKACDALTDFVEKALGAYDQKKTYKPEYLRSNSKNVNLNNNRSQA
jgi:hypothetical protein